MWCRQFSKKAFDAFNQSIRDPLVASCASFKKMKVIISGEVSKIDGHTPGFLRLLREAPTPAEFLRLINGNESKIILGKSPDSDLHRILSEKKSLPPRANLLALEDVVENLENANSNVKSPAKLTR